MDTQGKVGVSGQLGMRLVRADGSERVFTPAHLNPPPAPPEMGRALRLVDIVRFGFPQSGLAAEVNRWRRANLRHLWRGLWRLLVARAFRVGHIEGALYLQKITADGRVIDYGLASLRVVTDAGAGFIVDAWQNLVEMENMKYHGFGTGVVAEAVGDTALGTELTTQYATDNTRPTGTTAEASAKVFQTVATVAPDSGFTIAVTEHGVLSQAATGGGVLFDRSVFAAINLSAAGDSIQATYTATINSGS